MAPLYRCASVQQRFGANLALDLAALTLHAGCIHVLTGPNGSGKSTLLSILAFLSRPSSGEVWFDGESLSWGRTELHRLRKQVTLVHQFPYLFSGTVADNLAVGLRTRRVPAREIEARAGQALERVALADFARRDAKVLSGGEARRLALARALLLEPRVLLLDEPFANLDGASASVIEKLVAELPASGRTVVMSSHDLEHVTRLGGNIIQLMGGRLAPREGSSDPQSFVEGSVTAVPIPARRS